MRNKLCSNISFKPFLIIMIWFTIKAICFSSVVIWISWFSSQSLMIWFPPYLYQCSLYILPWQKRYNLIFKFCICFSETSNTVSTLQVILNKQPLGIITTTIIFTLARFLNYLQLDLMFATILWTIWLGYYNQASRLQIWIGFYLSMSINHCETSN